MSAVRIHVTGVVQGVGFRPFVYRIAAQHGVTGWVRNGDDGLHVHGEGSPEALDRFVAALRARPPAAADVASFVAQAAREEGYATFAIRESVRAALPTTRVSPDLAVCDECLKEMFDPWNRRAGYPYINCTNCGPRYSIVLSLPYDRPRTTMRDWPLCAECRGEYDDPGDRRFHAQPVACGKCGPAYHLLHAEAAERNAAGAPAENGKEKSGPPVREGAVEAAAALLRAGAIVAIKGIGGYHLACDARNPAAVRALRERKFRKERPFALMVRDLATARSLAEFGTQAERVLTSIARPIVLAPAKMELAGVAPGNAELGVMLPYAPLHHLLFAAGAPCALVLTSANRSSEPIAYTEGDAFVSLAGLPDAFLVGERAIARRMDDSIVRVGPYGPSVLRRARGYAPQAVAEIPAGKPILALGGDLKSAIVLVVGGQAFASQHIGDLEQFAAREAFEATVADLCAMYGVVPEKLVVAHDLHPGYHSTQFAQALPGRSVALQHHRAHVASVLAEHGAWDTEVVGFAFDGTGYGDDCTIWGGEVFHGTLTGGLARVANLRPVSLPGGDAAARFPVQAAAGFLHGLADEELLLRPPFSFPARFTQASELARKGVRTFETTSVGRLFDAVAALLGFTREQTFEGQAAMWLEHLARTAPEAAPYPFPFVEGEIDHRPLLEAVIADRSEGRPLAQIARAFHGALAAAVVGIADELRAPRVVASGGVFQNALLVEMLASALGERLWINLLVPPNDGGISLGQAALAAAERIRK